MSSTHELRAEARIAVTHRGNLSAGHEWFPCMVLDMSRSGFLMVSNRQLDVGQILDFRCELYPGEVLDCMIEVMHSQNDTAGMMITEIDDKATWLLRAYLEEQAAKVENSPNAPPSEPQ